MITRLAALVSMSGFAKAETKEEFDPRMAWFREARFGMFIHWGLYSVSAGEWKGQKVKGLDQKTGTASLLANPSCKLDVKPHADGLQIQVPAAAPDAISSVVILDLE